MSKEKTMKRSALILTVVGTLALMSAPAMATDNFYFGFGHAARRHVQTHVQLNHRAQHRDITHHNAHHYPLTYGQHGRLHYQLNHQAAHDRVSHYRSHATRHYYGGYGQHGVNIRIGGISFGFGH
jgi:pantothenate kinase